MNYNRATTLQLLTNSIFVLVTLLAGCANQTGMPFDPDRYYREHLKIDVVGEGVVQPGQVSVYQIKLTSHQLQAKSYTFLPTSRRGWGNFDSVPSAAVFQPNDQVTFPVTVTVPLTVPDTTEDEIRIRLFLSQEYFNDEARIQLRVQDGTPNEIFGPMRNTLAWSATIGEAPTSTTVPAVAAGVVYYGGTDGIRAFDAQTGQQRWENLTLGRVWSTPTVAEGILYVESDGGNIYALDATSGNLLWHTYVNDYNMRGQPRVADSVVYADDGSGTLYALNSADGTLLWQFPYHSGTLLWKQPNDKNITCACRSVTERLLTLDSLTGQVVFTDTYQFGQEYWDVVHEDLTFRTGSGTLYAIDRTTNAPRWTLATNGAVRPTNQILDDIMYASAEDRNLYAVDLTTGRERWRFSPSAGIDFQPVVGGNIVYVVSNGRFDEILAGTPTVNGESYRLHGDQALYALDTHTGQVLWQTPLSDGVTGQPVLEGTMLYLGTNDGKLQAFRVQ